MKKYFILAAAAAMFAACSNDNDPSQGETQNERTPLKIGTVTGSTTMRSPSTGLQDDAVAYDKTTIGLYILQQGTTTSQSVDYEKFNLQSSTLTQNTPASKYTLFNYSSSLYYPDSKTQGIDIYAYAPYSASAPASDVTTAFTLTTPTTQTYDDDFYAADFLWGCVGNGTASDAQTLISGAYTTSPAVNATISAEKAADAQTASTAGYYNDGSSNFTDNVIVPMIHLGSKIIIKVKPSGMAASSLEGATVTFKVADKDATLNLSTGALTPGTANTGDITMGKLGYSDASTVIAASSGDTNGTNGVIGDGTNVTGYTCAGVILPQTIAASSDLIKITMGTTDYVYKPSAAITFAGAKKYTFEILVTASGLKVTTTVADWTDGTSSLPDDSGSSAGNGHGKANMQ